MRSSVGSLQGKAIRSNPFAAAREPRTSFLPCDDLTLCSILRESEVIVGQAKSSRREYAHDAEPEWCLIFHRPLAVTRVDHDLRCTLQGSIRERHLYHKCLKDRGRKSKPAERNILAMDMEGNGGEFSGIESTLGELAAGAVYARMELEYSKENRKENVKRTLSTSFLKGKQLLVSVRHLQQRVKNGEIPDSRIIRILPPQNCGGYVQERWLKYQSALIAIKGRGDYCPLSGQIREKIVSDVVTRREYIRGGTSARLDVLDGKGECIGASLLRVGN